METVRWKRAYMKRAPSALNGTPPDNGWVFTWSSCCRPNSVDNLVAPRNRYTMRAIRHPYTACWHKWTNRKPIPDTIIHPFLKGMQHSDLHQLPRLVQPLRFRPGSGPLYTTVGISFGRWRFRLESTYFAALRSVAFWLFQFQSVSRTGSAPHECACFPGQHFGSDHIHELHSGFLCVMCQSGGLEIWTTHCGSLQGYANVHAQLLQYKYTAQPSGHGRFCLCPDQRQWQSPLGYSIAWRPHCL